MSTHYPVFAFRATLFRAFALHTFAMLFAPTNSRKMWADIEDSDDETTTVASVASGTDDTVVASVASGTDDTVVASVASGTDDTIGDGAVGEDDDDITYGFCTFYVKGMCRYPTGVCKMWHPPVITPKMMQIADEVIAGKRVRAALKTKAIDDLNAARSRLRELSCSRTHAPHQKWHETGRDSCRRESSSTRGTWHHQRCETSSTRGAWHREPSAGHGGSTWHRETSSTRGAWRREPSAGYGGGARRREESSSRGSWQHKW